MENIDPTAAIYELHVNGRHVANLCEPRTQDMFWCSYEIEPVDTAAQAVLRDKKTWETVNFTIQDVRGRAPNPLTFTGGYLDFCEEKTDRLSFRSLWPPQPTLCGAIMNWLARKSPRRP